MTTSPDFASFCPRRTASFIEDTRWIEETPGRFLEALSRRSQKNEFFRMRAHGLHEIRQRRALIMTAGDQDDRLVEGFHAFGGCIGIRSLGIIVVGNAIQLANKFDAVRKSGRSSAPL